MIQKSTVIIDKKYIQTLADRLKEKFHPQKIILFGSYGRGTPREGSDLDLLVIMQTNISVREQAYLIRREIRDPISVDVIVRTPAQVTERVKEGDFFVQDVIRKGIEL